jgi:hypothetical protein
MNTLDLLGRDTVGLQRLVLALAHMLDCAGSTAESAAMAQAYLTLLYSLRFHEAAAVRSSVMCGMVAVLHAIDRAACKDDFADDVVEIVEWCGGVLRSDPDLDARQLAGHCLTILSKLLEKSKTLPF